MILTAQSALNQVAETFRAHGELGDGRAAALGKTISDLAENLPRSADADSLALYFQCACDAPAAGRAEGAVAARRETCQEILSLLEALDAQPGEGSLLMATAIGRGWEDYSDGVAARATAMAATFRAETGAAWKALTKDL
jgi:hypothetical protein